jgi:hypothetical protein
LLSAFIAVSTEQFAKQLGETSVILLFRYAARICVRTPLYSSPFRLRALMLLDALTYFLPSVAYVWYSGNSDLPTAVAPEPGMSSSDGSNYGTSYATFWSGDVACRSSSSSSSSSRSSGISPTAFTAQVNLSLMSVISSSG